MSKKLRVKIDHEGILKWMFCDLHSIKNIKDLKKQIKTKYELSKFNLLLDDAVLPKSEPIDLLINGDTIKIEVIESEISTKKSSSKQQNGTQKRAEKSTKLFEKSSTETPESSSTESSESLSKHGSKNLKIQQNVRHKIILRKSPERSSTESSENSPTNGAKNANIQPKQQNGANKFSEKIAKAFAKQSSESSSSESESSESDEEMKTFEKSFNHVEYNPVIKSKPKSPVPMVTEQPISEIISDLATKKRKRLRKNKNKNRLTEMPIIGNDSPIINQPLKFPTQAKVTKFTDDNDSEPISQRFAASSPIVSCEDVLLQNAPEVPKRKAPTHTSVSPSIRDEPKVLPKVANGLDALLKLKDNPLVAKRKAQKDICDNKSVILTSATKSDSKFDLDKIDEYKTLEDEPEIGQILAFKCMQLSPDYTPQMIQYVGELKIKEGDEVKFLLLHDDSEGTRRSDKFEIGDFVQGTTKRNTVVEFSWRMINDIRLIE